MTVMRRGDRFAVKVWDRATKQYRWVGTYETLELAREAETDAAVLATNTVPTVAQWAKIWLTDHARPAASTRMLYRQEAAKIVVTAGAMRLDALSKPQARHLAQEWTRNTTSIARTMWGDAVRDGIVTINPFSDLRLPQSRGRKDIVALTEPQIAELAEIAARAHGAYGADARAIILTLAYTAVRPAELCALRWADVDLRNHEMHVRRSIDRLGNEKEPKNGKTRLITIPPPAVDALSCLLPRDEWVFHSTTGKPLLPATLSYIWRRIAGAWEAAGHPHIDLYELRHAAAALLLRRGLSASDVAVQLGHSDGGILVAQRYGHPDQALARDRLKMAFAEQSQQADPRTERASKSA